MLIAALLGLLSFPLVAQVRQASPEELTPPSSKTAPSLQEVKSPMLVDIPLGEGKAPSGKPRKALNATPGTTRGYSDAAGFVCDKARISVILVRWTEKGGKVTFTASPALSTDWVRQHVNLTVALRTGDKEIRREHWDDLVIGANSGAAVGALGMFAAGIGTVGSKAPMASWDLTQEEWRALWAGEPPTLRVILEIPE